VPTTKQNTEIVKISRPSSIKLPELLPYKSGYIKVLLRYTTQEPKHVRSHILRTTYGVLGPFLEETSVLLPQEKVTLDPLFFASVLTWLQILNIISKTAVFRDFIVRDEDTLTLAYLIAS
jgi:hypothetical protein